MESIKQGNKHPVSATQELVPFLERDGEGREQAQPGSTEAREPLGGALAPPFPRLCLPPATGHYPTPMTPTH